MHPGHRQEWSGVVLYSHVCSCDTRIAALGSEGALLRNMRFGLRSHPSMAKQENFDKILHFFAKKIHVVDPKMRPQKFAPLELIVGGAHGYAMVPEPPQVSPGQSCGTPSVYTHACKILPTRFAHRLPTFSSYLMLPHTGVLRASIHYLLPTPVPHEMDAAAH